jgi:hypothetical protein
MVDQTGQLGQLAQTARGGSWGLQAPIAPAAPRQWNYIKEYAREKVFDNVLAANIMIFPLNCKILSVACQVAWCFQE